MDASTAVSVTHKRVPSGLLLSSEVENELLPHLPFLPFLLAAKLKNHSQNLVNCEFTFHFPASCRYFPLTTAIPPPLACLWSSQGWCWSAFSLERRVGETRAGNPALCSLPTQVREDEIRIPCVQGVPPNGLAKDPKAPHNALGSWLCFSLRESMKSHTHIFTYSEMQVSFMACLSTNHTSRAIFMQSFTFLFLKIVY